MSPRSPVAAGRDVHAALASATRRRLLELVRSSGEPRDVQGLAAEVRLHLSTVRFHLEVLRAAGLLVRQGHPQVPGKGRPRTAYAAASPERDESATAYEWLATLLAAHFGDTTQERSTRAERAGSAWAERLVPASAAAGSLEDAAAYVTQVFRDIGFEPRLHTTPGGLRIDLRACPFRAVAREHPEVVCSVHLGLLRGALARLRVEAQASLQPFAEPQLCLADVSARRGGRSSST